LNYRFNCSCIDKLSMTYQPMNCLNYSQPTYDDNFDAPANLLLLN
jgi:hypothetical protein